MYMAAGSGALRQGEILQGLVELRYKLDKPLDFDAGSVPAVKVPHPWAIVLSPDCDLDWDYKARQGIVQPGKLVSHVLFCDLEDGATVRADKRIVGDFNTKLVKRNGEARYHYIASSIIDGGTMLGEFFVDFKRTFSLPADFVYATIRQNLVKRCAVLQTPWVQHMSDRFTHFLGRVALPDEEP